ncbi:MAG: hypothetical protein IJQ66_07415 [Clostridia bacterium]|nr:hypothetical protein [Clostridia bacterium]
MYLKQCEVESRVEFFKGDIQEIIKSHTTIKKWAYILHDKDDTAPHYHIYLNFNKSGVDTKQIAEWFGLQESQVNRVRGRAADMLLYLTHGNDSQKNKYQYSPTEVVANFDFESEIKNAQILGDFEHFSYAQQLEYVNSLPVSEKPATFSKLEKLWKIRCQWLSLQSDRSIDVMFICGKGGTGKTFYAKKLLSSMNLDYCISSSSNDPFQDYLGQKAIILDDLRDKTFERLDDLLKILDNNTVSSVKSRFANKVFNGEIIVITSSVPLRYWYREYRNSSFDTLDQLYRRIGCYVEMTYDEITVFSDGVDEKGNPKGLGRIFKNELSGRKKEERKKTDFNSIFEKICSDSSLDISEVVPTQTVMKI